MNTSEHNPDKSPSPDVEEEELLVEATKQELMRLRITGSFHDKICKLVRSDTVMTHNVLTVLEFASQRERRRIEQDVDRALHAERIRRLFATIDASNATAPH